MFDGFEPTRKDIKITRDYCLSKLTFGQLAVAARGISIFTELGKSVR